MKPCPHCKEQIPPSADSCPFCGEWLAAAKPVSPKGQLWVIAAVVLLVLGVGVAVMLRHGEPSEPTGATGYQTPATVRPDGRTVTDGGPGPGCRTNCVARCQADCRGRAKKAVLNETCAKQCPPACERTCSGR